MAISRIYIASSILNAYACNQLDKILNANGFGVTSRWHRKLVNEDGWTSTPKDPADLVVRKALYVENVDDIKKADALVFLPHTCARGSIFEVGFALGWGLTVLAVGNRVESSLMLDGCIWVSDEIELLMWFSKQKAK